jgi:hypothetical protein
MGTADQLPEAFKTVPVLWLSGPFRAFFDSVPAAQGRVPLPWRRPKTFRRMSPMGSRPSRPLKTRCAAPRMHSLDASPHSSSQVKEGVL